MFAALKDIIPGAQNWPSFERNASEQYEARLVTLEILESPSILLRDMVGSRIPIAVAHGEGRALFAASGDARKAGVCVRFVDNAGHPTEALPAESQRLAEGRYRPHGRRGTRDHPDAASRARVPQRADVVGAARVGGGFAVDAHLPQRARMGGVMAPLRHAPRARLRVLPLPPSTDDLAAAPVHACGPSLAAVRVLHLVRVREPARLAGRAGLQVS